MRWVLAAACAAVVSFALAPAADAKGCIKGAIVGGVAGHWRDTAILAPRPAASSATTKLTKADKTNAQAPAGQK